MSWYLCDNTHKHPATCNNKLISIILFARLPTTYGLYITDMYTNTASLDNLLSSQVMCTNILSSAVIIHHHHQGARFLITYLQVKPIWQVTHTNTLPSAAITYYHQGARFDNIPTGETYLTGNTHKHFAICSNNPPPSSVIQIQQHTYRWNLSDK